MSNLAKSGGGVAENRNYLLYWKQRLEGLNGGTTGGGVKEKAGRLVANRAENLGEGKKQWG